MILFLDPDPKRAVLAFQRMTPGDREKTIWCKTFLEAQTTLFNYRHELTRVHLEHDLGEQAYMNTASEESGMEIVRYLERLAKHSYPEFAPLLHVHFIVHTWNEHAGPLMVERLRNIGLGVDYTPFGM
jgi:hypothetical protein